MMGKSIYFNHFIIETPQGKTIRFNPVNAYAPDFRAGSMANKRQYEQWARQFVDACPELRSCAEFVEARFEPARFLRLLKEKGYKVHWVKEELLRKEGWRLRKQIRGRFENEDDLTKFHMQLKFQCTNAADFLNCECCDFVCGWKGC